MSCSSLVKHFPGEKWPELLREFSEPYMTNELCPSLEADWHAGRIHPPKNDVFKAFHLTPFDCVSVVVLGNDPYPNPRNATGLAFSVPATLRQKPASLQRIYAELEDDPNVDFVAPLEGRGDLSCWAEQGVLLLNCSLTRGVNARAPQWEKFTDRTIELLVERDRPIAFLFWGTKAWRKSPLIRAHQHFIRCAGHPDPRSGGFIGCRHFSQTNAFLAAQGLNAIKWDCVSNQAPAH